MLVLQSSIKHKGNLGFFVLPQEIEDVLLLLENGIPECVLVENNHFDHDNAALWGKFCLMRATLNFSTIEIIMFNYNL